MASAKHWERQPEHTKRGEVPFPSRCSVLPVFCRSTKMQISGADERVHFIFSLHLLPEKLNGILELILHLRKGVMHL